jgi:CHAD domain-containing protein
VNDPVTHREVERKFVVGGEFELPDVQSLGSIADVSQRDAFSMHAVYYDTSDLALFRWGITMRHRLGGDDAGWHLKVPVRSGAAHTRDEMHMPDQPQMPAVFVDIVSPLLMGRSLEPIVDVNTVRKPYDIHARDTDIELVDDHVTINQSGVDVMSFREIEIEVVRNGSMTNDVMDELSAMLIASGGKPSSVSKAARALGQRTREAPDVAPSATPKTTDLAADALRSMMSRDVTRLLMADVDVRRDANDGVHQMRVAARRLRSTLRTFSDCFEPQWAASMREDLAWIASEMGTIRDTEVLQDRLVRHGQALPPSIRDTTLPYLIDFLDQRRDSARSGALAALRSDRHDFLIEDLVGLTREPKFTNHAFQSASDALIPAVRKSWRSLRHAMSNLDDNPHHWHAARIKAKRTRYAVESLTPIFGKKYGRFGKLLAELTEELGLHQDCFVAQEQLADMARSAPGDVAFGLGLLSANEATLAVSSRGNTTQVWPRVKRAARGAGL